MSDKQCDIDWGHVRRIYLDSAATTKSDYYVLEKYMGTLKSYWGNPSSVLYDEGSKASEFLEYSRAKIEAMLGIKDGHMYFTSGGTESDNWAIKGVAWKNRNKGNHIITTKIEHHAILKSCEFLEQNGFDVTYLDVDEEGIVDPDDVVNAITDKTILISIGLVNNEIGTIQDVKKITELVKKKAAEQNRNIYVHTDAVQAIGHMEIDIDDLGVDLLSISAHKFYGVKGVGGLYIKDGLEIEPLLHGGSQEYGLRASTVNVPGVVAMKEALDTYSKHNYVLPSEIELMKKFRDKFVDGILNLDIGAKLIGAKDENRVCNNANIMFPNVNAETLLILLDDEGVSASTGSACNTGNMEPSHVLKAIGLTDEEAHSCIRFSFNPFLKEKDIDRAVEIVGKCVDYYKKIQKEMQKEERQGGYIGNS